MKKLIIASIVLMAMPVAGMAAPEQTTDHTAGSPIDQSHPGSTLSASENASAKHLAAAAAHEQAAMHHKAAANAQQPEQAKEHAMAAEKASLAACEKSKEALSSPPGK
ncbi:hypothetical protein [Methylomicrobium lacus]|uniref:hypothetical protein n=1 Tax=Methylomicrobium lacus TaxID=136992 RepID=UPI0035A9678F